MTPAGEVDPPPLLEREGTPVESAATLQGTEGLDELEAPNPVSINEEGPSLEQRQSIPQSGTPHLDELASPPPAKDGISSRHDHDLEGARQASQSGSKTSPAAKKRMNASKIYILSYLVFFSILGTLARLGLQAITVYPGAPVALGEIWANVAGTLVMGFLAEDRSLFQRDLAPATQRVRKRDDDGDGGPTHSVDNEHATAQLKREHMAIKKGIPPYTGLSVGFCGSLTTFSSFMRDAFLALSDDLDTAPASTKPTTSSTRPRNAGYSVEAALAVLVLEVAASLAALGFGAHLALFLERPVRRRVENGATAAVALLAWPAWLGAVAVAGWPPHAAWRGRAVFALAFAPAGCLLRFGLSRWLNARAPRFPAGTFAANVLGTLVLGVCFDLQHGASRVGGGVVGCQVLQGVMDGFCGCLTTVSTWALELKTLRRSHAYVYGVVSLAAGLGGLVVVMGGLRWTVGFEAIRCKS